MHQLYEPLLVKYSVDIVFNGHVHSYERSKPVSNYTVDSTGCAPMHVVIGDAGNVEGAAKEFITAGYADSRWNCNNPTARKFPSYQPQACLTYQSGVGSGCASNVQSCYCFNSQVRSGAAVIVLDCAVHIMQGPLLPSSHAVFCCCT
jgi:3',5'-cyclic AMP phosphodiesterase CpdA